MLPTSASPTAHRWLIHLVSSLVVAALFVVFVQYRPFSAAVPSAGPFYFQAVFKAQAAGEIAVVYQLLDGRKGRVTDRVRRGGAPQLCQVEIPAGRLTSLRLMPAGAGEEIAVAVAEIVDAQHQTIATFSSGQFQTMTRTTQLRVAGKDAFVVRAGPEPAVLNIRFDAPLALASPWQPNWGLISLQFLAAMLVSFFCLRLIDPRFEGWLGGVSAWMHAQPRTAVFCAAMVGALVSCHPVVFGGKSFVAPATSAPCLYDSPVAAGLAESPEDVKGSDTGAMVWAHLPYSVVEHRAIFQHGELPLWIRENSCGVALLGQGQSMIGDPLHWVTIAAGGAAWAWDLKFVCAKILFALGIGLCVFAVTRNAPIAALLAASSTFIGFFAYRLNHPAYFSLCYSPWILLCWLKAADAATGRRLTWWALVLIVVNWTELNSGTAKESAMLLVCLNATGALAVLLAPATKLPRWSKLGAMVWSGVLFVLLSAPAWMVFLAELKRAYTISAQPPAYQIQPALLIGLFDDLFYRQITLFEMHFNPSANLLVLLGVLWAIAGGRRSGKNRAAFALSLGSLLPLALAFGAIPQDWIKSIPFLSNVSHIDNTFSCVLIVHLLILAGVGLHRCCAAKPLRLWNRERATVLILLAGLLALYFGFLHAAHRTGLSTLPGGEAITLSPFFANYAAALLVAIALLPPALRRLSNPLGRHGAALAVVLLCLLALHFRHGMYSATKFDAYVVNPRTRVPLDPPSPALDLVRKQLSEPARVAGFGEVLTPGFSAVLGLESIGGADAVLNPYHRQLIDISGMLRIWEWRIALSKNTVPKWQRFADMMNLRFYLGALDDTALPAPGLTKVGTVDLEVLESPTVWPRAFFTNALASYDKPGEFARLVNEGDGRPFAATQRLDPRIPFLNSLAANEISTRAVVPATDYRLTANSTTFTIDASSPGIAVLTEAYVGGDFEVTVDGAPATVLRTNHAFNGVLIETPGRHVISFRYWPSALTSALWLAFCGAVLLLGTLALALSKHRQWESTQLKSEITERLGARLAIPKPAHE